MANRYPICKSSSETIKHLFLLCPFDVELWKVVCGFFVVLFRTFDSVMDMLLFVSHRYFCPHIFQLWVFAVLYSWDFIWQAHNMRIFQENQFTFHHFFISLKDGCVWF